MTNITAKKIFIFILFSISNLAFANDTVNLNKENKTFNENHPAQITETNAEFVINFY